MNKKMNIDLGKTPTKKIFWYYAIPAILAMVAHSTAGLIDSIFIGKYVGSVGLSAVTLVMPILALLIGFGAMFAAGGTALAGIFKGKGDDKTSNNLFNVTNFLLLVVGVISGMVTLLLMGKFAGMVGVSGEAYKYVVDYGKTVAYFFPIYLMNFSLDFFLKLDGKPILAVVFMLIGVGVNIILNYVFIVIFGWGLMGAALGTGLSNPVSWIIAVIMVVKKSTWKFALPIIRLKEVGQIVFNGTSEFLSNIAVSISGFVYNLVIIKFVGLDGVAAFTVAMQVSTLGTSIGYAFSDAALSPISFNYGAKLFERVKEFFKLSMKSNVIIGAAICVVAFFFGGTIAKLFVSDPKIAQSAAYILKIYAAGYILMGANIFVATYFTAIYDPIKSGGIALYHALLSLLIGLFTLPYLFGADGIWMVFIFSEATTFVIGMWVYRGSLKKLTTA